RLERGGGSKINIIEIAPVGIAHLNVYFQSSEHENFELRRILFRDIASSPPRCKLQKAVINSRLSHT
ncbi:MAG: hypothetical protein OEW75_13360, partial [Cyclobacteriaceae bacterium]|nr:hypothetical protein [Cyclobacteriaceae bacterium]